MKELTIEEKAKAYDEAIKRAREIVNNKDASSIWKDWLKNTFTELKEDEDEKIRKYILKCCEETIEANDRGLELSMDTTKKLKNWLERQGCVKESVISQHENKTCKENDGSLTSEDEEIRCYLINFVKINDGVNLPPDYAKKALAWLDKQGNNNQNWKPSKEQINALEHFVRSIGESGYASPYDENTKLMHSLLHDLKKFLENQNRQEPIDFKAKDFYVSKVDGQIHDMTYSSANKVESKFKVGDWIIFYGGNPFKILKVEQEQNDILDYLLLDQNGRDSYYNKKYVDENARLWTIQDAKDGDILTGKIDGDTYILIYKQTTDRLIETYGHYYNTVNRFCAPSQLFCKDYQGTFTPASKKQRNLLFAKMKEAGYKWDSEKKELIKVEQRSAKWSEEDETRLTNTIIMLKEGASHHFIKDDITKVINWLKSLKQRIGG